jgi:hypothetical protein
MQHSISKPSRPVDHAATKVDRYGWWLPFSFAALVTLLAIGASTDSYHEFCSYYATALMYAGLVLLFSSLAAVIFSCICSALLFIVLLLNKRRTIVRFVSVFILWAINYDLLRIQFHRFN